LKVTFGNIFTKISFKTFIATVISAFSNASLMPHVLAYTDNSGLIASYTRNCLLLGQITQASELSIFRASVENRRFNSLSILSTTGRKKSTRIDLYTSAGTLTCLFAQLCSCETYQVFHELFACVCYHAV